MFNRTTPTITLMLSLLVCFTNGASAQNWTCGKDLNGDGYVDAMGETQACISNALCPIEATACQQRAHVCHAHCAMSGNTCVSPNGPTICEDVDLGPGGQAQIPYHHMIISQEMSYTCPLNPDQPCINDNGAFKCSPNSCVDMDAQSPETIDNIDGSMLIDDGQRDSHGRCLEQNYIFSGRAMECKKSGKSTGFKNCCKDKGKIFNDSIGSATSIYGSAKTIQKIFDVAKSAYTTYSAAISHGASTSAAISQATAEAQTQLLVAVDPTSLAISVAIYFITDYLTQACDQSDMEAAMLNGSGYCVYVGEYCKHRWPIIGCVQRAKTFCCFNSKMGRIIHQQGRGQLKSLSGFGNVTNPNCRGFTPEEFQALDFSKIDLSEYYSDLTHKVQADIQSQAQGRINEYLQNTR